MDIDDDYTQAPIPTSSSTSRTFAPIDDAHPFDLDAYISNYSGALVPRSTPHLFTHGSGRPAVDRLIHIIRTCPSIAPEAFELAVHHVHQSRDPSQYQRLLSAYDHVSSSPDLPINLPNPMQIAQLNTKWADEVMAKNAAEKIKLEVELKTYTNNMIKESIRVRSKGAWI